MPRCSACEIRKEAMRALEASSAQQASVIEALTRALDAVRPAAASHPVTNYAFVPQNVASVPQNELPSEVRQAVVTVGGFEGPMREYLEQWATEALAFGMPEAEVSRRIFEGDHD